MIRFPGSMHTHTNYGHGANSPEEMILAAIDLGFSSIGISEHAWAPYDLDVCIPKFNMEAYRTDVVHLKEKYADSIEVCCGLEVDFYNLYDKSGWDYIVGSAHYVQSPKTGEYHPIDWQPAAIEEAIEDAGVGSAQALVEMYGANVLALAQQYRPDIMGHIDVIAKLNRGGRFFDPGASWYKAMWEKIVKTIAQSGCIAEVNTGGMARGYTDEPYPSVQILQMLHREGVPLTVCSDAHEAELLSYGFDHALDLLREVGYKSVKLWQGGKFTDLPI